MRKLSSFRLFHFMATKTTKIKTKVKETIDTKANRAMPLMMYPWMVDSGIPMDWKTKEYLELYGRAEYSNPTVHGIIKAKASAIANCPLKFFTKDEDGNQKKLPNNHDLVKLFYPPNPVTTRYDLIEATVIFLELAGDCFWGLEKLNGKGQPKEIWVLSPEKMKPIPSIKYVDGYVFDNGVKKIKYATDEVMVFKHFDPLNPWRGQAPMVAARQQLILDYYIDRYHVMFFKVGAVPSGVFSTETSLNNESYKRLQKELELAYTGVDKAHRPMLLESGLKWTAMGINPKDGEYINLRALNKEGIAGAFITPSQFTPGGNGLRFGNVQTSKEQARQYWGNTIKPLIAKIEEVINTFLVRRYADDIYAKFDLSGIETINDTNVEKSLTASRLIEFGIMNANEARKEFWNLPPRDGGDIYFKPTNILPEGTSPEDNQDDTQDDDSGNNNGNGRKLHERFAL